MKRNTSLGLSAAVLGVAVTGMALAPANAGYDDRVGPAADSYDVNAGAVSARGGAGRMSSMMTVTGRLVRDADDKNFEVRDTRGRIVRIETSNLVTAEAWNKLQEGDTVRAYGEWRDGILYASNLRYLGRGYVARGTRVYYAPYYYRVGDRTSVVGTLVTDADDDEFELRSASGRTYMIRTRQISDAAGANQLQEGDRVRVYGYWFVADNKPQLEATNFAVLSRR